MKIVFLCGSYYPNFSAVGRCVHNVVMSMENQHDISVICRDKGREQKYAKLSKHSIVRVSSFQSKVVYSNSQTIFHKILKSYYKIYSILSRILSSRNSILKKDVNMFLEGLYSVDMKIDLIVCAAMPFETIKAASLYCEDKKETKYIPYIFDQFTFNSSLNRFKIIGMIKKKSNIQFEKEVIEGALKVIVMKQLYNYYLSNHNELLYKIHPVEHPLLLDDLIENRLSKKVVNIVYAGSFYKKIRPPKKFLEFFINNNFDDDICLRLYSFGNCDKIISKVIKDVDNIVDMGFVSSDEIRNVLGDSDILVALGNKTSTQFPSKIFEYMSYAKPIAYFYSSNQDRNLEILKMYKNSICINLNDKAYDMDLFNKFIFNSDKRIISYDSLKQLYPDAIPSYTANIIVEQINRINFK